jgi:hypothetical protein
LVGYCARPIDLNTLQRPRSQCLHFDIDLPTPNDPIAPTKKKAKTATGAHVPSAPFAKSCHYKSKPIIESEDENPPPIAGPSGTRHETLAARGTSGQDGDDESRGTGGEDGDGRASPLPETAAKAIATRKKQLQDAKAAKERMEATVAADRVAGILPPQDKASGQASQVRQGDCGGGKR